MTDLIVDNPFTLQEAVRRPYADDAVIDRVLDAAGKAAPGGAKGRLAGRVALCWRAGGELEAQRETIAADVTRMMGKPLRQSRNEIAGMAKRARYMCSIAEASLADTVLPLEGFQ